MASPPSPPPDDALRPEPDLHRRRRGRNIAMLVALLAMSGLFYAIAIVKLGKHVAGL